MKKVLLIFFEKFGGMNVMQCCFGFQDEFEIPDELIE